MLRCTKIVVKNTDNWLKVALFHDNTVYRVGDVLPRDQGVKRRGVKHRAVKRRGVKRRGVKRRLTCIHIRTEIEGGSFEQNIAAY